MPKATIAGASNAWEEVVSVVHSVIHPRDPEVGSTELDRFLVEPLKKNAKKTAPAKATPAKATTPAVEPEASMPDKFKDAGTS
jgi:hypothetical protein